MRVGDTFVTCGYPSRRTLALASLVINHGVVGALLAIPHTAGGH